jgi:hypothetical protein
VSGAGWALGGDEPRRDETIEESRKRDDPGWGQSRDALFFVASVAFLGFGLKRVIENEEKKDSVGP